MLKLIIFDMDGLMFATEQVNCRAFMEVVKEEGYHPTFEQFTSFLPEKNGLRELLNAVKEKKLHTAVASGSDTSVIKEYLEKTGLTEYFDMVLSSKDVKRGKPYPDVFLEICQKFDVKPEETLVLEDSSNGVQAALAGNLL